MAHASRLGQKFKSLSCADDIRVNNLIEKAVKRTKFKQHHVTYPETYLDPEAMHKLLLDHPCPLAQGPVICAVDGGAYEDSRGRKVMTTNTTFQHQESQECVEWIPIEKNKLNLKYDVTDLHTEQCQIQGAASNCDMCIVYTCQSGRCRINCSCSICMDKTVNCKLQCRMEICSNCTCQCTIHKLKLPRTFNVETDQFTLVTNQTDVYRYAVPHAGIPKNCEQCRQDVIEHQIYHLVFHMRCRYCRHAARPLEYDASIIGHYSLEQKEKELDYLDDRTCAACLKEFSHRYVRIRHEEKEHNGKEKTLSCNNCNKKYSNVNALNHHIAVTHQIMETKFTCELCGSQFLSKANLSNHRKLVHEHPQSFQCEQCEKTFTINHNLLRHMREEHNDRNKNLDYIEDLDKVDYLKCDYCEQLFKRKSNMLRHVNSVHSDASQELNAKTFQCDDCPKSFLRKDALKRHKKTQHSLKNIS